MRSRLIIIVTLAVCLLASCSPRIYPYETQRDSVYINHIDSVYLKDSVFVDRLVYVIEKGDTVIINKEKVVYKEKTRDRVKMDTVYVDKVKEVENIVEVERDLTWWQKFQKWGFWILLAGIIIVLIIKWLKFVSGFKI